MRARRASRNGPDASACVIVLAVLSARALRSASRGAWDAERLNIYF
jgi:hypothetical protein